MRRYEEKQITDEVERLRNIKIVFEGSVINLVEVANGYGVSVNALKKVIKVNNGYLLLGDQLITSQTLEAVGRELNGVKKHSEALSVFGKYAIKSQQVLDVLGYRVKWNGLDPDNTEIVKI